MTLDSTPLVNLDASSGCRELHDRISHNFAWLFAQYPVQIKVLENLEQDGGCSLVYLVDEAALLRFDADRGGIEYRVGPAGAERSAQFDWVLPTDVIHFLRGDSPLFTGFPEWASLDTDSILRRLSADLEPKIGQIIEFYRSGDYNARCEEFRQFCEAYGREYLRQVDEYYADLRGGRRLTAG